MTSPFTVNLDALQARGLRGVVWLGQGYNQYCHWENDDAWIRSHVAAIAGHPAIIAYYLGDEPSYALCPESPARYAARSALLHSLDPGHPTFTVLQVSDHGHRYDYGRWAASVDILGLDVYPCNVTTAACDFGKIDEAVAAATQARLPSYWAVIQDFKDSFYRLPTRDEVAREFDHWDRSAMSGYLVFSWNFRGYSLDSVPANIEELKAQNANHGA